VGDVAGGRRRELAGAALFLLLRRFEISLPAALLASGFGLGTHQFAYAGSCSSTRRVFAPSLDGTGWPSGGCGACGESAWTSAPHPGPPARSSVERTEMASVTARRSGTPRAAATFERAK